MRRIIEGFCLLAALLGCACNETARGNGQRVTEYRPLAGFTKVDSASSVDVLIEQGDEFAVTVSIDSNLQRELRTRVDGDTLGIDSQKDLEDMVLGPHVIVTLPELRAASLSGSGEVNVSAPRVTDSVALLLSGSGRIDFEGTAPEATVRLSGSGAVTLKGSAATVDLNLDGSGEIDAVNLPAADGRLDISGSGDITATLRNSAQVDISGSGDVYLYGDPALSGLSVAGSGMLHLQ